MATKERETEKEEQESEEAIVTDVPTQTTPMIVKAGKVYTVEMALAKIMNDVEEIKKGING